VSNISKKPKKKCPKCGKSRDETEFMVKREGGRMDVCKRCMTALVDNRDPSTFLWILEELDVPYVEDVWIRLTNEIYLQNPSKFGPSSVLGIYKRQLQLSQYKGYGFADSDTLNKRNRGSDDAAMEYYDSLVKKLEAGKISQQQFDALNPKNKPLEFVEDVPHTATEVPMEEEVKEDIVEKAIPATTTKVENSTSTGEQFIQPFEQVRENEINSQLTEEDIQYLAVKWGTMYKPTEWVYMEDLYSKYVKEYEMNTDRENSLRKICKTSLKFDQAMDVGDANAAKSFASILDQLRKSAKFTEAQNKEDEQSHYLDSVGELIAFCEMEGGIIEQYPDPQDYPQDKIDITIRDLQNYTQNLVSNEHNLGNIIESYIKKLEAKEKESAEPEENQVTSEGEEEIIARSKEFEEVYDFSNYIQNEVEQEAQMLLQMTGGLDL
jgi:hypothetical protein